MTFLFWTTLVLFAVIVLGGLIAAVCYLFRGDLTVFKPSDFDREPGDW